MQTPKTIKVIFVCVLLIAASSSLMLFTGCTYGPGKEFVDKMDKRAALHLPRLKFFIENATIAQLEKVLDKPEGTFKDTKEEDVKFLKDVMIKELDAWVYLIQTNKKLLDE